MLQSIYISLGTLTCQDVQIDYQSNGCCGDTSKSISLHSKTVSQGAWDNMHVGLGVGSGPCPDTRPSTNYWKFNENVFGGYEGCVSGVGVPCHTDYGTGWTDLFGMPSANLLRWNSTSMSCDSAGVTEKTRGLDFFFTANDIIYDILNGMKLEEPPVFHVPLRKSIYDPSTYVGIDLLTEGGYRKDFLQTWRKYLVYNTIFTKAEIATYDGEWYGQGTENMLSMLIAIKARHISSTTCTRKLYLYQRPMKYGFDMYPDDISHWVNKVSLYGQGNSSLCPHTHSTPVSLEFVTTSEARSDGNMIMHELGSTSVDSPFIEITVNPNNPDGRLDSLVSPPDRRICDGVYLSLGNMENLDPIYSKKTQDCWGWAFSTHKIVSGALVKNGFSLWKQNSVYGDIAMSYAAWLHSFHHLNIGITDASMYVAGGMMDWVMSKPISDPSSYTNVMHRLQQQKWKLMMDGFQMCLDNDVFEIVNTYGRAATVLVDFSNSNYTMGQDESGLFSLFFSETMGMITRAWVQSSAEDANTGQISETEAVRISLYSELYKYHELKRRAHIVCSGGSLPGLKPMSHFLRSNNKRRLSEVSSNDIIYKIKNIVSKKQLAM